MTQPVTDWNAYRKAGLVHGGRASAQAVVNFVTMVPIAVATYIVCWSGWLFTNGGWDRHWVESNPTGIETPLTTTSRSASGNENDFNRTPFTAVKIAVLAPTPSAMVRIASSEKPMTSRRRTPASATSLVPVIAAATNDVAVVASQQTPVRVGE